MLSSIMENEALSDAFWLLHQLMVAGNRYAKLEGLDAPEVFSLDDMIDLVGQVLSGEIQGRPSNVSRVFTQEPLLYASYGRAEMQYLLSQK